MEEKNISRRKFLVALGAAGATAAVTQVLAPIERAGAAVTEEDQALAYVAKAGTTGELITLPRSLAGPGAPPAEPVKPHEGEPYHVSDQKQWVMVIDLAKCDGCRHCQEACQGFHYIPPGQEWIKIYNNRDTEGVGSYWFPRPCMQCENPPCVKVCPVGASYKREDGIILIDQDRCIGCRFCIPSCPYSARYFNWGQIKPYPGELDKPYSIEYNYPHRKGVAEKCIFCPAKIKEGKLPVCVANCPMDALLFGDLNEDAVTNGSGVTFRLTELLAKEAGHQHLADMGTKPRVYYLPPRGREVPAPPPPLGESGK